MVGLRLVLTSRPPAEAHRGTRSGKTC